MLIGRRASIPGQASRHIQKVSLGSVDRGPKSSKILLKFFYSYMERCVDNLQRSSISLTLMYLQFIDVWRSKESLLSATRLANLLLVDASKAGKDFEASIPMQILNLASSSSNTTQFCDRLPGDCYGWSVGSGNAGKCADKLRSLAHVGSCH